MAGSLRAGRWSTREHHAGLARPHAGSARQPPPPSQRCRAPEAPAGTKAASVQHRRPTGRGPACCRFVPDTKIARIRGLPGSAAANPIILIDLLDYVEVVELKRRRRPPPGSRALRRRTPAGWFALAVSFAVSVVAPGMPLSEATVLAWLTATRTRLRAAPSTPAREPRRRD
jgi:hypothetical protein